MQRHRRDEYENLDEYETDEEEVEEDEERDEGPELTTQQLEYLQLRQRLKESIRKQKRKGTGSAQEGAHQNNKSLPYDNYGSFFGPSKPVISQRVIEESKSILENQLLTSRNSNASSSIKKNSGSKTNVVKPGLRMNPSKVISEVRVPVQKRQDTRDYSFLLSDDAELPVPTKEPPTKRAHISQSEARSSHAVQKSKQVSSSNGSQIRSGREERRPASMNSNSNMQRKTPPQQMVSGSKSNMAPSTSQKQFGSNSANDPGRPVVKQLPSRMPVSSTGKKISAPNSNYQSPPTKNSLPGVNRSLTSKNLPLQKQPMQPRREYQEHSRSKPVQKQPSASSKPQMNRPVKQVPPHSSLQEYRPKKKPARGYSDDDEDAIGTIRKLFGYNPKKYAHRDYDDDSDMEACFDDILREEKRSEKIARKEDEEELLKTEEEERRARERKRKMSRR